MQWRRWGSNPRTFVLQSSALPLSHCALTWICNCVVETVWILISWLLMKPADLDLHCFQKRYSILEKYPCSALIRSNMVCASTWKICLRCLQTTKAQTDQHICYSFWKVLYLNLLQANFQFLTNLCSCGDWFESHFDGNPEDKFCPVEAYIINGVIYHIWQIKCMSTL